MFEDTDRKVKMSPELMNEWATRDVDGNLLTWDWGEPGDDGFYVPTISVNYEDNLVSRERQHINLLIALQKTQGTALCNLIWNLQSGIRRLFLPKSCIKALQDILATAEGAAIEFMRHGTIGRV